MAKHVIKDWIDWAIIQLADGQRGSGSIATDIARRLPCPKCAVGIVQDDGQVSFYVSSSSLDVDVLGRCVYDVATSIPSEITLIEREGVLILAVPLPETAGHRTAVLLAAAKSEKDRLMDNKPAMEQLVRRMSIDEPTKDDTDVWDPTEQEEKSIDSSSNEQAGPSGYSGVCAQEGSPTQADCSDD